MTNLKCRVHLSNGDSCEYIFRVQSEATPRVTDVLQHIGQLLGVESKQLVLMLLGYQIMPRSQIIEILRDSQVYDLYINLAATKLSQVQIKRQQTSPRQRVVRKKIVKSKQQIRVSNPNNRKKELTQMKHKPKDKQMPASQLTKNQNDSSEESDLSDIIRDKTAKPQVYKPPMHRAATPPPAQSVEDFVAGQVSYYFSDKNYYGDRYIQERVRSNPEGWMSTQEFLTFPKIKKAVSDKDDLVLYLGMYENPNKHYELSWDGSRIRKRKVISDVNLAG